MTNEIYMPQYKTKKIDQHKNHSITPPLLIAHLFLMLAGKLRLTHCLPKHEITLRCRYGPFPFGDFQDSS